MTIDEKQFIAWLRERWAACEKEKGRAIDYTHAVCCQVKAQAFVEVEQYLRNELKTQREGQTC